MKKVFLSLSPALLIVTAFFFAARSFGAQCVTTPAGIVSWWSGESNAFDNAGLNHGIPVHSPSFAHGAIGTAFKFNGQNQCVLIPDSPSLHFTNALTIEAWIFPTRYSSADSILVKYDGAQNVNQSSFSFSLIGSTLYLNLNPDGVPAHGVQLNSTGFVPLNIWTHVAGTYDGSTIRLYINGNLDSALSYSGGIYPGTDNMAIGANVGGMPFGSVAGPFNGMIDEVSLYKRALSPDEIQAIYNAATAGKCPLPLAITVQPTNTAAFATQPATFSVGAAGAQPLFYQWYFHGTKINGATAPSLLLTNLQKNQGGTYRAEVSDAAGHHVNSHNATLTALPAPPCFPTPANLVSWWSGESNALDNVGGNNGVLVNSPFEQRLGRQSAPGTVSANSPPFAFGKVGTAFDLNGYSQFVRVPDQPNLHLTGAMTLEAWVCPTAYNPQTDSSILCKYDAPGSPDGQASWSFFINGDGRGAVLVSMNGENGINLYSTSLCPLNAWTHLAATYDGANLKIFFNGVQQDSVPMTGNIFPGTDDLGIGANIGGVSNGQAAALFAGMIDEPAIYSRALSSAEILGIYNAGVSGKCPVRPPSSPRR